MVKPKMSSVRSSKSEFVKAEVYPNNVIINWESDTPENNVALILRYYSLWIQRQSNGKVLLIIDNSRRFEVDKVEMCGWPI